MCLLQNQTWEGILIWRRHGFNLTLPLSSSTCCPPTTFIQPAEDEGSQTKPRGELEILCPDYTWNLVTKSCPCPLHCREGKGVSCLLPVAWSLANCKSSAIGNSAACSLMFTQQEGNHGSFCPLRWCLAERRMKSIFALLLSPFNKPQWKQI